jgi:hypothetical protein
LLCGLLNAYAFGTMGMIAGICAIAAFIADAVMLMLSGLGLMYARRFSPAAGILGGHPARARTRSAHHRRNPLTPVTSSPPTMGFAASAPTAHPGRPA